MERDILGSLNRWKSQPRRKPLILRGARQVGKSWVVDKFASQFTYFVKINFEEQVSAKVLFEGDLLLEDIIPKLRLFAQKPIKAGETLIFFDEVQECEGAQRCLRYFKEKMPELHVIAAGSLIEFSFQKTGVPVGRVQYLYLYPLSFGEFLSANDRDDLRAHIHTKQIDLALHEQIMEYVRTYMWLGGMPEVVDAWLQTKDPMVCHKIQDTILETYRGDFNKYARRAQIPYVRKVFDVAPMQIGQQFRYANVDRDLHSRPVREAVSLLEDAGVLLRCPHTSSSGKPLGAEVSLKKFKLFFLDVGLAQRLLGIDVQKWATQSMTVDNIGSILKQFVAQEIVSSTPCEIKAQLYYWHREARSSHAEVDFLLYKNQSLVPVKVTSQKKDRMKSMHLYLESHDKAHYGLKISELPFWQNDTLEEIPFYGVEAWLKDIHE